MHTQLSTGNILWEPKNKKSPSLQSNLFTIHNLVREHLEVICISRLSFKYSKLVHSKYNNN